MHRECCLVRSFPRVIVVPVIVTHVGPLMLGYKLAHSPF